MSNLHISDEIFMPKADGEIDNGEMDEVEKELEEFKRLIKDLFINTCTYTQGIKWQDQPILFILKVYVYTHAHYIPESRIVSNQINTAWG